MEVDVDAIRDADGDVVIGGVMEHIEEAGVHSGDSASAIPPQTLTAHMVERIETQTRALADALDVRGLLNVQYAVKDDELFVIEANPRASRTVPFVSKATGVPLAKVASRVMVGRDARRAARRGPAAPARGRRSHRGEGSGAPVQPVPGRRHRARSRDAQTGEVMGIDRSFGMAFAKSQTAAGNRIPREGTVFLSLADRDKARAWSRPGASPSSGSRWWPPRAPRRRWKPRAWRSTRWSASSPPATHGRRRRSGSMRSSCSIGEGRPRDQHAPGTGPAGRRRPHPPHRHRPGHPVRHHGGGRARRLGRDRRVGIHRGTVRSLQEYHRDGQLRLEV